MPMNTYLTHLVIEYRSSIMLIKRVLFKMTYSYPQIKEERSSFLLAFSERIESILNNFIFQGFPFEAYYQSCLKWFYKTFKKSEGREAKKQLLSNRDDFWENTNTSDCITKEPDVNIKAYIKRLQKKYTSHDAVTSRFLIVALKNPKFLDEKTISKLSMVTGIEPSIIFYYKEQLIRNAEKSYEKQTLVIERKNRAYYMKNLKQTELAIANASTEIDRLNQQIAYYDAIIKRASDELKTKHFGPRNHQIAEVLGIPKGTVDSAFYYFKKNFNELLLNEELRYA